MYNEKENTSVMGHKERKEKWLNIDMQNQEDGLIIKE